MKPPFQKDRKKLDLEKLKDWPKKVREDKSASMEKAIEHCPYCESKKIVKRGTRKKKLEEIQRYLCKKCSKTFTPQKVSGKTFPLKVIIDGLSYYNMGYSMEESCNFLKEHYGITVNPQTLSNWLREFEKLCTYSRMREHGKKLFTPNQVIQSTVLYHRQVYKFHYHRAKTALILQDFKHEKFEPLCQFLDAVSTECPHQLFKDGMRASQVNANFDLSQVMIKEKFNFAVRLAQLVIQAVADNRQRHEILQKFMLANDSVTVACEVPVWIDDEDLEHFRDVLGFDVPNLFGTIKESNNSDKTSAGTSTNAAATSASGQATPAQEQRERALAKDAEAKKPVATSASGRKVLTGHIDILQVRNGSVHIMDYKPNARKEKPIEQLTMYALALSRLTGLRLYELKCAWFDDRNYYEFFPLHVVYKKKGRSRIRISKDQIKLDEIKNQIKNKIGVENVL